MLNLRRDHRSTQRGRGGRNRGGLWPNSIGLLGVGATLVLGLGAVAHAEAAQTADAEIVGQVLKITGTNGEDQLVLRPSANDANVLEVDVGDDGKADFSFARALFAQIEVHALNGNDLIRVDEMNGSIIEPTSIFGENGNDAILGGAAIETIDGGRGDDFIDGNRGADIALMGKGNDTFKWDQGDGSDVVEGESGTDTLLFNGAGINENVDLSANGGRLKFFRVQGSITMDVNQVEIGVFNALGGADTITVNDLTGTGVTDVDIDLENPQGSGLGDGQADRVIVNGTAGDDRIAVTGSVGNASVTGLAASVAISHGEAANDRHACW
jgi:Ca2+-binding RTX toxin-like protein